MTNHVHKVIEISIAEGKLFEFNSVASQFIEKVKDSEADMLTYDWYLNDDGAGATPSSCIELLRRY